MELQSELGCVILHAIQRPKRLFSAWDAFLVTLGLWQQPGLSMPYSLAKSTPETEVLEF